MLRAAFVSPSAEHPLVLRFGLETREFPTVHESSFHGLRVLSTECKTRLSPLEKESEEVDNLELSWNMEICCIFSDLFVLSHFINTESATLETG
jgi:hypothetical protein